MARPLGVNYTSKDDKEMSATGGSIGISTILIHSRDG